MASFVVLVDFEAGPVRLRAGTVIDDGQFGVPGLVAAGLAVAPMVPAMVPVIDAYLSRRAGDPRSQPEDDLVALLLAAALIGGGGGGVPPTRLLTAGDGLTGGGDLSADRTFAVLPDGDGSIVAAPAGVAVGVLATDAQHGARGGGALHDVATLIDDGFMSAADKTLLAALAAGAVPSSRTLTAGAGLTGGGDLSADRTFDVGANADGSIAVNANDIQVGVLATDAQHGNRGGGALHADVVPAGASGFMSGADKTKLDGFPATAVPTSRLINTTAPITGGGDLSADRTFALTTSPAGQTPVGVTRVLTSGAGLTGGGDLSADRTLAVGANADGSITVNADDVQVGVLATDAQHGNRGGGGIHAVATTSVAGFLAAADKVKLDALTPNLETLPIVDGATIAANDLVAYSGSVSGRVIRCDARFATLEEAFIGVAVTGGTGDAGGSVTCTVQKLGSYTDSGASFTPGAKLYASVTGTGRPVHTVPSGGGNQWIEAGWASTSTVWNVQPGPNVAL